MSVNAIEKGLWQAFMNPAEAQRLRQSAQSYWKDFRVDDQEASLLSSWKINALLGHGVNPMVLMMAYATINGPDKMAGYIEMIHRPD